MSDINQEAEFVDENGQDESEGVKSLRAALKKANEENTQLKSEKRQSEVTSKLTEAGLPPEAAKFAKDADDLDSWIEEHRGLFNTGAGTSETQTSEEAAPQGGQPSLSPEQIKQMQATQMAIPSQFQPGALEAKNSELSGAKSKDEIIEMLEKQGRLAGRSLA